MSFNDEMVESALSSPLVHKDFGQDLTTFCRHSIASRDRAILLLKNHCGTLIRSNDERTWLYSHLVGHPGIQLAQQGFCSFEIRVMAVISLKPCRHLIRALQQYGVTLGETKF